jgi:uncharacterized membrane protein
MIHRFGHPWMHGHPWGNEFVWWPGMLLSVLSVLFLVALLIGLIGALLMWVLPSVKPMLKDTFGMPASDPSALEILRMRYAAGELDSVMFEQMWERLIASYHQEGKRMPRDAYSYQVDNRTAYGEPSPFYGQGKLRMAEQEHYNSETEI